MSKMRGTSEIEVLPELRSKFEVKTIEYNGITYHVVMTTEGKKNLFIGAIKYNYFKSMNLILPPREVEQNIISMDTDIYKNWLIIDRRNNSIDEII